MFVSATQDFRQHQTTAHLAQTMSFLALPIAELETKLLTELDENPALELVEELRCPGCGKRLAHGLCPTCAAPRGDDAPVVYLSQHDPLGFRALDADEGEPREIKTPERLDEYILRQVGPALSSAERPIAAYLLAQIDDNGFLTESPAEAAVFQRAPLATVERVLALIQRADPPGICARTPEAALLIQLECLADDAPRGRQLPTSTMFILARAIIRDHFERLAKCEYTRIAHRLHVPRTAVEAAARFIQRNLTPYPARAFWGEGKAGGNDDGATLIAPDVNISMLTQRSDGPLLIEVFAPLAGWLRVNPEFKAVLTECSETEREKWAPVVERATLITKCVQQRNHTMRRLMALIAAEQRDFILGGDGDLRPLTRARVAKALGVHESTISRAVAGKFAALPNGRIVPLARFFDRSLSVRDRVRCLVETETRPMTDDEIAAALGDEGIRVARRTVAKYRNMLGILPANVRARVGRLRVDAVYQLAPI